MTAKPTAELLREVREAIAADEETIDSFELSEAARCLLPALADALDAAERELAEAKANAGVRRVRAYFDLQGLATKLRTAHERFETTGRRDIRAMEEQDRWMAVARAADEASADLARVTEELAEVLPSAIDETSTLKRERDAARKVAGFARHEQACAVWLGDGCDCGLDAARKEAGL